MSPWGVTVPPPTEAAFFNAARSITFLLVEGETDARFWLARVDRRACQVRSMGGRERAIAELRTVLSEGKGGFVALLDADFDRIDRTLAPEPHVVWTDLHDLDTVLIASPALDKVLAEVASPRKCQDFEATEQCTVREALLARGIPMGRLRWLSKREGLGLSFRRARPDGSFKHIDHAEFCGRATWQLEAEDLVRTVLNVSSRHRMKVDDVLSRMSLLPEVDAWQLCVGHDLVGLLMVGLRSKLGSRNLSIDELEERLRLAFERVDLERTEMFGALRCWEDANAPFRIFPSPLGT